MNELKKFHQAVYIGARDDDCGNAPFLHLPKPGPSCIWRLEDFGRAEKEV
jgi:hypothetical protein